MRDISSGRNSSVPASRTVLWKSLLTENRSSEPRPPVMKRVSASSAEEVKLALSWMLFWLRNGPATLVACSPS